jgi:Secretion system C-terminal sorting domain/Fibronectin type III domain/Cohesin domain
LPNLQTLLLPNNQLSGAMPNFNLSNLQTLNLSRNQLSGAIPNFTLLNLESLVLSSNLLTGTISNFNCPKLVSLWLDANQLTGTIPNFNYPNLQTLLLNANQLSGLIPNFTLPSLQALVLHTNQLTGAIPNFNFPNLTQFLLQNNQLSGCLPSGLRNLCSHVTMGSIANNVNLATQDWTAFCANGTGQCCPTIVAMTLTPIQKCSGTSLSLATNTIVGSSYSWTNTAGTVVSTQQNPIITASSTTANSGTYTCTIKDANGCVTNTVIQQVTINSSPVFQLPGIGQEIFHLCNGNSFTFPFQAINTGTGTLPITYSYTSPTATTLPYPYSITSINNNHSGSYRLVATDANGCKGSIDVTLAVWDNPTIYAITNAGTQCTSSTGTSIMLSGSDAPIPNVSQTGYFLAQGGVATLDASGNPIGAWGTGGVISLPVVKTVGVYEVIAIRRLLQTQGSLCSQTMQGTVTINPIPTPATPSVSNILATSATISWTAVTCGITYKVEYKTTTATTWTALPNTANVTANLTGLTVGTAYNVRVEANGVGMSSSPSVIANFTTTIGSTNTAYLLGTTAVKCSDAIINIGLKLGQAVQNINGGYAININYNSNQLELVDALKGAIVPADATLFKTLAAGNDVFGIALGQNNISGATGDILLTLQFRLKSAAAVANTAIVVSAQIVESKSGVEQIFDANTTYTVTGSSAAKIVVYTSGVLLNSGTTTLQWTGANSTQTATLSGGQTILNNTGNTTLSINRQVNIPIGAPTIGGQDAFKAWNIMSNSPLYRPIVDEIIAADVDGNGSVTIADITGILRRAVGLLPTGFPQTGGINKDWRFYPKSLLTTPAFTISATYPLCDGVGYCKTNVPIIAANYPLQITSTNCDTETKDWHSVLIGNVTGTTGAFFRDPSVFASLRGASPTVKFMLTDSVRTAAGLFIPMFITDIGQTTGLDMTFTSPALIIQDLTDTLMFRSVNLGSDVSISAFATDANGVASGSKVGYLKVQTTVNRKLNATDFGTVAAYVNEMAARIEFSSPLLAVELTTFEAHPLSKNVELTWLTSSEQQNDHFEIQWSKDGKTFSKIGNIKGQGTTSVQHDYQFLDESPLAGINYYRLKQVDVNGQSEFSKIVSVDMPNLDKNISIYPNPVKDKVMVETNITGDYTIELLDIAGKLLQSHKANQPSLQLSTSGLPSGMYMISVKSNTIQKTFKIVKQ